MSPTKLVKIIRACIVNSSFSPFSLDETRRTTPNQTAATYIPVDFAVSRGEGKQCVVSRTSRLIALSYETSKLICLHVFRVVFNGPSTKFVLESYVEIRQFLVSAKSPEARAVYGASFSLFLSFSIVASSCLFVLAALYTL